MSWALYCKFTVLSKYVLNSDLNLYLYSIIRSNKYC